MAPELVESINALGLGAGGGASLAGVVLWFARRAYLDALSAAREHAQRVETRAGAPRSQASCSGLRVATTSTRCPLLASTRSGWRRWPGLC